MIAYHKKKFEKKFNANALVHYLHYFLIDCIIYHK